MKTWLGILSIGSFAGAIAVTLLLVSLLRSMPGGPYIGGAGVVLAIAAGAVLVVLLGTGVTASIFLRRHGHAAMLQVHFALIGVLLVGAAAWSLSIVGRRAETQQQAEAAWQRSRQEDEAVQALLADPARLAAHVAQHGVHAAIRGTWMSPLEAAASNGHTALVTQLAAQGATVTENALAVAVQRGDTAMLAALLAHRGAPGATGMVAMEAAYRQGRGDLLRQMASAGLATDLLVKVVIDQKLYLQFAAEDVDWQRARDHWSRPDPPPVLKQAIDDVAGRDRITVAAFDQARVLEVLNALVVVDAPDEPGAEPQRLQRVQRLQKPPGHLVREPAGNWRFLRELHPPGVIVAPHAGTGFRLLLDLTAAVPDKSGGIALSVMAAAVASGDTVLLEALVRQGYDLRRLQHQGPLPLDLQAADYAPMKAWLDRRGIRLWAPSGTATPRS